MKDGRSNKYGRLSVKRRGTIPCIAVGKLIADTKIDGAHRSALIASQTR